MIYVYYAIVRAQGLSYCDFLPFRKVNALKSTDLTCFLLLF